MRAVFSSLLMVFAAALGLACQSAGTAGQDGGAGGDAGVADGGTWYKDVLPIVQDHCQQCHVSGGIAPFALFSYQDGLSHSQIMAQAVTAKLMPPWKPAGGCQSFIGDRSIPQSSIDTIVNWSNAGAPAGNPADAPPPSDAGLPGLPRVDAQFDAGFDYTPAMVNGPDDYHCFIVSPTQAQSNDVIGVNIVPGQRSIVHHVILFQTTAAKAQAADSANPGHGWTCFGSPGTGDFNMLGGWVPGSPAQVFPQNTGIKLLAGNVVVMQVHYNMSTAAAQPDRTLAQLEFSPTPVAKEATILGPIDDQFRIPPNAQGYSHSINYPVQANVTVWGVQPHMHTKGTQINVSLTDTSAQTSCLIDVPSWNFSWQQMYFYKTPLQVAVGSQVNLSCTWNNPTAQTVTWGEGTADEMCLAFFYVTF